MGLDSELRRQLEGILADLPEWLAACTHLEAVAQEGHEDRYRPFVFAFGYRLIERSQREKRERVGGPFGSAMSTAAWQFPPPLEAVDEADVFAWSAATEDLDDPVSGARLNDLLWERKLVARPDRHARAAIDAYVELSGLPHWHMMDRAACLTRGLELCQAVSDEQRTDHVVERGTRFVEEVIGLEERGPGAAIRVIVRS